MDSIVITNMDDTDTKVPFYMSEASDLASDGVTFAKHFVASPVCSPSRASLMLGKFPHNHGVIANDWPRGGYGVYGDLEADSIFVAMQAAGYYCVLVGKYQNHYQPGGNDVSSKGFEYGALHVPAGLDDCLLFDEFGYKEWKWTATQMIDGGSATLVDESGSGFAPAKYATRAIFDFAVDSVGRAVTAGKPLFMIISPFSTHNGSASWDPEGLKFPPDPKDRELTADRPGSWGAPDDDDGICGPVACTSITSQFAAGDESANTIITNPTAWHSTAPFSGSKIAQLKTNHINRIRMAQSVDRGVTAVRAELVSEGLASTTHVVLTSDNGFHLGEHVMAGGKSGPYDHDTRTHLIWRPPGGTTPTTVTSIVNNVDVFNTCLDIAGEPQDTTLDGRSFLGFIEGTPPAASDWRKTTPIEFTTDGQTFDDYAGTGEPPTSRVLRDADWLFVNFYYDTHGVPLAAGSVPTGYAELFRLTGGGPVSADPWQTVNQYPTLTEASRTALVDFLDDMLAASGAALWTLQKQAIPALVFGEVIQDPGNLEQFIVVDLDTDDEFDMSTLVRNVETSNPTTAPLRGGEGIVVPHHMGRVPTIEALPDSTDFALNMWAAGGTSGTIADDMTTRSLHRSQLDQVSRILVTGGQRGFKKRFDTTWRYTEGRVSGSINFNTFDERFSRFMVGVQAHEGSWRDLSARTDTVEFDPAVVDNESGLWTQDLWFTSFAGSSFPLQFYVLELYGQMSDPTWESLVGQPRLCQYMQHIGKPARLTVDTLAVTAVLDQPEDDTFTPEDEIEQIRRPYGCFPILWPRASDGAYGLRVTTSEEPGHGAEVHLTGYRRYQLRG